MLTGSYLYILAKKHTNQAALPYMFCITKIFHKNIYIPQYVYTFILGYLIFCNS